MSGLSFCDSDCASVYNKVLKRIFRQRSLGSSVDEYWKKRLFAIVTDLVNAGYEGRTSGKYMYCSLVVWMGGSLLYHL